ncbi:MAG TPA: hypothetical protein VFS37_07020 [Conexibacter sp.]|nr:hypothetical protein [Conexibacter sp.]
MRSCKLLLLAMLSTTVLLGSVVGSAGARNISSNSQTFRTVFRELRFEGVFGNIVCKVTLEGSMHARTITKSAGSLIGYITRADLGPCQEGRATILRESLPWHVRYASFTGTLPTITGIRQTVTGFSYRIQEPIQGCLLNSSAVSPVTLQYLRNTATGVLTGVTTGGSIMTTCGITGGFSSDLGIHTVLNAITAILLTLI